MSIQKSVSPSEFPAVLPFLSKPIGAASKIPLLLTPQLNAARISRLTAEQRILYDRIRSQRERLSPVEFHLVEVVRENRQNG